MIFASAFHGGLDVENDFWSESEAKSEDALDAPIVVVPAAR